MHWVSLFISGFLLREDNILPGQLRGWLVLGSPVRTSAYIVANFQHESVQ